jgi:hypothetical protein
MMLYVLDEHGNPRREDDVHAWSAWHSKDEQRRSVRRDTFERDGRDITVSTVFLGIDHSFGDGQPVLWETMVFGLDDDDHDDHQYRFTSRDEAVAVHERIVADLLPVP